MIILSHFVLNIDLFRRIFPVTPEQVAEYTNIPLATIYQKLANREIPGSKPGKRWVIYLDEIDKWLEANRKNPIPLTDEEQNATILASHKRKPNKSSWQTDPMVEPSKKVNVANSTTSKPKAIAETDITPPTADAANDTDISNDYKDSNEITHSTASNSTVAFGDFNASDVTSSFDQLKVIYKKVGNNESQAFGVWLSQRLFYIIGSLSLLSIITIVLEIAFYMYFHWM